MFKHILIATDGSELAKRAVSEGLDLGKALKARITAVTVTLPWSAVAPGETMLAFPVDEYERGCKASAKQILGGVEEMARATGVVCDAVHIPEQFPAEGIVAFARQHDCDLIVMASHGRRGLSRLFLGSQANSVVTHSEVPVLICR
jgi:nucleotide-binding universal stress UspA family protein